MAPVSRMSALLKRSTICAQCFQSINPVTRTFTTRASQIAVSKYHRVPTASLFQTNFPHRLSQQQQQPQRRLLASAASTSLTADEILDEIQEQYAAARDEFEIATEETEGKTIYAADDRAAAREELKKLKDMFEEALQGAHGEEVRRRVGPRIRELETAVEELNKADYED
ncbi:hypothetical protein F5884DRAFT_385047 [Xylogone sp. PMI_703]|nr:hypothetical protein F5884DRAFT_385047 [Xylogone sp. PMI_703]